MLFLPKNYLSIVYPSGGIGSFPVLHFDFVAPHTFIHRRDGTSYDLADLLQDAISAGQVLELYSNAYAMITAKLVTGQFFRIDVASLKRGWGSRHIARQISTRQGVRSQIASAADSASSNKVAAIVRSHHFS
jgi:hypothetical protein